jgi:hypothetical protein
MTPRQKLTRLFLLAPLLCAAGCPRPPQRDYQAYEGRASILAFERDGRCQLRLGPDRFSAPPGAKAVWEIRNECAVAIEPEVFDFEFEGSLEGGEPAGGAVERFEISSIFEPGNASRPVEAGGIAEIDLRIKRDARPGRYRYQFRDVKASGEPGDPKLDIWPPI